LFFDGFAEDHSGSIRPGVLTDWSVCGGPPEDSEIAHGTAPYGKTIERA
jgi:hypothetical protein